MQNSPGAIGRITPAGGITEFPTSGGFASNLTVGPDGDLWFAENFSIFGIPKDSSGAIGRITPAGGITEFPLPTTDISLSSLTVGPDGNLWFTAGPAMEPASSIGVTGRITPAGDLAEFPLPAGDGSPGDLTVGPDGNLWFVATRGAGQQMQTMIGRITPADANGITEVQLSPAGSALAASLTVGPDGNLWSTEDNPGRIERIAVDALPPPPSVTGVVAVAHSGGAITSIRLGFDEALDPGSAREGRSYSLAAGVKKGRTVDFRKGVRIAGVSYDRAAHAVRLRLAVPQKGSVQVTVRAGLVAADGMSSSSDFTAVVM